MLLRNIFETILLHRPDGLDDYPTELQDLYRGKRTKVYIDSREVTDGIRTEHVEAAQDFLFQSSLAQINGRPFVGYLGGPMAAGKSTVDCLVSQYHQPSQAFKHEFDQVRGGKEITNSNCREANLKIPAKLFGKFEDILANLTEREDVVLIDEIEFAKNDPSEVHNFLNHLRACRKRVLLSGLDLDFRRQPWPITSAILREADFAYILTATCVEEGCGNVANFTQRTIDGQPAHFDDPVVLVGSVADSYTPKCAVHHQVLPPKGLP